MDLYPLYHVTFSFQFYIPPMKDELCGLKSLWIDKRRGVIQVIEAFAEDQMSSLVPVLAKTILCVWWSKLYFLHKIKWSKYVCQF